MVKTSKGKKALTVRERTLNASKADRKPRRLKRTASNIGKGAKGTGKLLGREYYLKMPNNRLGRFLNKPRSLVPRYFRESWHELHQVAWPSRKETWKLTLAVFTFALVFGLLVAGVDYILNLIFKKVLLG